MGISEAKPTPVEPEVVQWLCNAGARPSNIQLDALILHRLTPLAFCRLAGDPHPERSTLLGHYNANFQRMSELEAEWNTACETLGVAGIGHITLGSLPYGRDLYADRAARFSQDIDLLVDARQFDQAKNLLRRQGWQDTHPSGPLRKRDVYLDLHSTPGEEARYPTLRGAYGLTTEELFQHAEDYELSSAKTKRLTLETQFVNRSIHFFKHRFIELRHGVDLILLSRLLTNPEKLREAIEVARAGVIVRWVVDWLRFLGVEVRDPIAQCVNSLPRVSHPLVGLLLSRAFNQRAGSEWIAMNLLFLPRSRWLSFASQVLWPRESLLSRNYGVSEEDTLSSFTLRWLHFKKIASSMRNLVR